MPPPVLEAEVAVVHVLVPVEGLARTRKRKRENKNGGDQRVRSAIREREEAALSREEISILEGGCQDNPDPSAVCGCAKCRNVRRKLRRQRERGMTNDYSS